MDLNQRASEILTDEENDFWSAGFHDRSIEEAICLIAEFDGEGLAQCVEYTTTAGSLQILPEDVAKKFLSVDRSNGKRVIKKSFDDLARLDACYESAEWEGAVEFYDMGCGGDRSFELYPTPPAGHTLRLKVVPNITNADGMDCKYQTAIINFCLYRAFEREGSENGGKVSLYRQAFYDVLGVFKALDVEEAAA